MDISFFMAPLIGWTDYWTGNNEEIPTTFIPQLECDIRFKMYTYPPDPDVSNKLKTPDKLTEIQQVYGLDVENNDGTRIPIILSDNSYLVYVDDFAFLKVEEANTEFLKENVEVEAYRIISPAKDVEQLDDDGNTITIKQPEVIERLNFAGPDGAINKQTVEYYFEIETDFDIEEAEFCQLLKRQKETVSNIYTDKIFNCEKTFSNLKSLNIYDTNENNDIEDVCD